MYNGRKYHDPIIINNIIIIVQLQYPGRTTIAPSTCTLYIHI